ncbi:hypothetical protein EUTSA_v10008724mg [Eutrema salsugineum]|uniref:Uncharacterized protein n=1 Tax=Eutrema salsugineum TaxID=72664 RepID=V4KU43_EUTSA|nr:hypothetical protein EUTSA_v10008724mg [Eutrema salsugineum]
MGTLGRAFYSVGFWIRETGQALDRLGCRLQGKNCFREQLSRHRTLMNVFDKAPIVDKEAFVAPSASVIGDVQIGRGSSIWYGCVLRGDANTVTVGSGTNIQDNSLVHVAKSNLSGKVLPTIIGDNVTIGHSAVLHGCTVRIRPLSGWVRHFLTGSWSKRMAWLLLVRLCDKTLEFLLERYGVETQQSFSGSSLRRKLISSQSQLKPTQTSQRFTLQRMQSH